MGDAVAGTHASTDTAAAVNHDSDVSIVSGTTRKRDTGIAGKDETDGGGGGDDASTNHDNSVGGPDFDEGGDDDSGASVACRKQRRCQRQAQSAHAGTSGATPAQASAACAHPI